MTIKECASTSHAVVCVKIPHQADAVILAEVHLQRERERVHFNGPRPLCSVSDAALCSVSVL